MNSKKKIFIVDNVIIGANHVISNAGTINTLQSLYPSNTELTFFADAAHIENVKSKVISISNNVIHYNAICVLNPLAGIVKKINSWRKKLEEDYNIIISILEKARKENVEFVLFCTIIPYNLNKFQKLFSKYSDIKIIITLHGEIEYLFKNSLTLIQRLNAYLYKKAFKKTNANVRFMVLSTLIRDKMIKSGYIHSDKIFYIQHPINEFTRIQKPFPEIPTIAQIGVASRRKGSEKLFEIAEEFENFIQNKKIEFQVIGKVYKDIVPYQNNLVSILSENNQHMSQEVYERFITDATFSISLVTGDEYIYRISGSLLDSLQYQLPLIALRHECVDHIFQQAGDIGYLCNDINEIKHVVHDIINKEPYILQRYPQQIANLKSFVANYYNENNVKIFRENLEETGWVI